MSATLARLRKRAAEFEQKKQFDRALEVYVQILDEGGKDLDDEDVPLFNRVGDMLMRKGSVTEALGYYERAVDVYAERGYLNNAIALCSKILRQSPGRAAVYYKLARISAKKGFKSDARKNFLEYADRMQKLGMADEAFRALKEFASLYPDQDDVRLVLAELLQKENRKGEAIEQLQSLYQKLQSEGRAAEARATVDRMRAIDPTVTPREGASTQSPPAGDLVFLDLTDAEPVTRTPKSGETAQPVSARAPIPTPVPALTGLSITFLPDENEAPHPEGFEATAVEPQTVDIAPAARSLTPAASELVIEPAEPIRPSPATVDAVATEGADVDTPAPLERIEHVIEDLLPEGEPGSLRGSTPRSVTPLSSFEFADVELDEEPPEPASREHDLALPADLPDTPEQVEAVPAPLLESDASFEDARAAAEEAADLVADIATREAAQQTVSAAWTPPPQPPLPNEVALAEEDTDLAELLIPETVGHEEEIPDDFMAMPPTFGQPDTPPAEEHAFPPLLGLEEAPVEAGEQEPPQEPAPATLTPRATVSIGSAESHLRSRLELDPENWDLHRQLGEALFDTGDRDGGLFELELAMAGFEDRGEIDRAQEIVDEILGIVPGSVAHHQKRVEFAVRSRDRSRLTHSYLELADALFRTGAADKAVAVYGRVLELDHQNERAEFALATLAPEALVRLRGGSPRPERWTNELDTIEQAKNTSEPPPPAGQSPSPPDEAPETGAAVSEAPATAPPPERPRIRFSTLELPVSDWGEGVPARPVAPTSPAPSPTPAAEPGLTESQEVQSVESSGAEPDDSAEFSFRDLGAELGTEPAPAEEEIESPTAASDPEPRAMPPASSPGARPATPKSAPVTRDPTPVSTPREPTPLEPTPLSIPREPTPLSTPREPTPLSTPREPTPLSIPREPTPLSASREPTPAAAPRTPTPRATPTPRTPTPWSVPAPLVESTQNGADADFVDLGEWLRNTEPARSTRMQVEDPKPTGDEQADFEEMLRRFKRGVAENVEAEDYDAHYDLGVAYKEMGLIDEAIAQFQKALRGPSQRVRSYEALGQCFVEKEQYPIAAALLQRATEVPGADDQQLVGVLYLLGFAKEHLGRPADALPYYLRVFAVDIEFRDIAERVAALGNATK